MLICIYIIQRRSGYVVSLATPTKAELLYKVHTHAGPAIEVFLFTHIFSPLECPLSEVQETTTTTSTSISILVFFIRSRGSM